MRRSSFTSLRDLHRTANFWVIDFAVEGHHHRSESGMIAHEYCPGEQA
jgi:hypothetical protein